MIFRLSLKSISYTKGKAIAISGIRLATVEDTIYFLLKNASELQSLTDDKKSYAMKALPSFAKFIGKYAIWLENIDSI